MLGKPISVTVCTWIAVRLRPGDFRQGTNGTKVIAASPLAGIGFTMSLFIAALGFGEGELLENARIGIIAGSLISGAAGFPMLRSATGRTTRAEPEDVA